MATPSRQEGDLHVNGHLTSKTAALPAGTLTDDMVNASAGLSVTKMRHQYTKKYADESATAASDQSRVLHIVHGTTGEVLAFKAGAMGVVTSNIFHFTQSALNAAKTYLQSKDIAVRV